MIQKLAFLLCVALMLGLVGSNAASGATLDLRITNGNDDVEEFLADGDMDITSSDLEFPYEDAGTPSASRPKLTALRFALPLAKGAKITKAYLEVEQDETKGNDKPVNVIIEAQLVPNAPAVTGAAKDLSGRTPWTTAKVKWTVPMGGKNNDKFQSPDLTDVLTELVNQAGWASGNAILLAIRDDPDAPSTGLRCVEAVEGEATAAALLHVELFSPEAKDPNPANGATEVTSPLLQWTAGDGAIAHQVYIGTSPTLGAAEAAGGPIPMTMYFHVAGFVPGTTYYWRVDETAADGTVATGTVWSFTAMPVAAYLPSPADGGVWQRNDTTISWKAGSGAASHKVYGGTDKAAVAAGDASVLLATQAETSFAPTGLKPLTVYYWRVDEVDPTGAVVPGSVWTINVAGMNTGSWRTAAADAKAGYLATYVQNGTYDIGTFGGEQTFEFVVRSNPDEKAASMALIGRLNFGDTKAGLKYEQWNNTKNYGATVFGVKDYDYQVPNAPGEFTHLAFVASTAAAKTDLYVNGELKGSVPVAIVLSGQVGIGRAIRENGTFVDDFDGNIFGVAIYDRVLSDAEIAANSARFLQGGPEAVTLAIKLTAGDNDAEEHLNAGMDVGSSDLEIPYEDSGTPSATDEQLTCLRYILPLAKGAQVTKASVEFTCDETKDGSKPVNLIIEGQLALNPPAFTTTAKDLTGRAPWTAAQVAWAVENWTAVGQKSSTPDLAAILQELVNQEGWVSENAVVLAFRDDKSSPSTGLRCADAFEDGATLAPVLRLEVLVPWPEPPSYTYNGDLAAAGTGETTEAGTSLDGTWSHENGSDAWDGTAPGAGAPGGAGVFTEDTVTFLRIQDTGDPRDYGKPDPSNRKVYFQHPVTSGLDGTHLEIRIRVATTGVLDPVNPDGGAGVSPWPATGAGMHIRDDGKGMFGIAQPGVGIISFSLARVGQADFPTATTDLLVMNNLVGTTSSGDVDTGVATAVANTMALADASQWNTIVVDIAAGGTGTHVVTVSVNGGAPQSFDVTAGTGIQGTVNYIALGSSGTGPYTAFDVDYFRINE